MPKSNTCLRCKNKLPVDSSFCPACGMTNHSAAASRGLKVEKKLEERASKRRFWSIVTTLFRAGGR